MWPVGDGCGSIVDDILILRTVPFPCLNHRFNMLACSQVSGKAVKYTAISERSVQQV
jgi:hypothetical protein